jgi:murein L,D-transpeptidase YcbB/YkuD
MKTLLVTLLVSLLAIWPVVAGAQQQGKPQMGEPQGQKGALHKPLDQAQMRQIEERLKAAGFDPGPVDGAFTAETDKALRDYQRKHALRVVGLLGEETYKALMSAQAQTPGVSSGKSPGGATTPAGSPAGKTTPAESSPGGTTR